MRRLVKMKKFFATAIILLMLLPLLVSCKTTTPGTEEASKADENAITVKDMNGREVKILCWHFGYNSKSILGFTGEVITNVENEEDYGSVDVAKSKMRAKVEEKFNCKITGEVVGGDQPRLPTESEIWCKAVCRISTLCLTIFNTSLLLFQAIFFMI
jgi:hypothetical protein